MMPITAKIISPNSVKGRLMTLASQTLTEKPPSMKGLQGSLEFYAQHLEKTGDVYTVSQLIRQLAIDLLQQKTPNINPETLIKAGDRLELAAHKSKLHTNGGTELPSNSIPMPKPTKLRPKYYRSSHKGGTELP